MSLPIHGLIDLRNHLPTNPHGWPGRRVPLAQKVGVVVHYHGPAVARHQPIEPLIAGMARHHIDKDWSDANEPPVYGDGLMYHIVIGHEGEKFLCRDLECVLYHCAIWPQNATALAVQVPIGGDQRATPAQLQALHEVCVEWLEAGHGSLAQVWGHRELSSSACPGTLMEDFVLPFRSGERPPAESNVIFFPETGHGIGHGFKDYWLARGSIPIFGYPLTDEFVEPKSGLVVQYFERAVFESHPDAPEGWRIQLRRLGAAALDSHPRRSAVPA